MQLPLLVVIAMLLVACTPTEPSAPAPQVIDIGGAPAVTPVRQLPAQRPSRGTSAAALYDPSKATAIAPDSFRVRFGTSNGDFVVELLRAWAPHGVDRFYNLAAAGYYTDVRFFRVIANFVVQFGIHGDPEINRIWDKARIPADAVRQSNSRGFMSFAMAGPTTTRTVQLFINLRDNSQLDNMGFAPIGRVVEGMSVVESLYNGYGSDAHRQQEIRRGGNAYLLKSFPKLDYIKSVIIIDGY